METLQPFTALLQHERLIALSYSALDLIFVVLFFDDTLLSGNLQLCFKMSILLDLVPHFSVYLHLFVCAHLFIVCQGHLLAVSHWLRLSEPTYQRFGRLLIVRNHVVPTDLRTILYSLKRIISVSRAVILEELLDSSRLILAAHIFT